MSQPRRPRSVPPAHALAWFGEAIRLWKRAPITFSAIALVVLALSLVFEPVPIAGLVISNLIAPLLGCGLFYASLAADRGAKPRFAHLVAAFMAPLRAQAAVVASALAVTVVQGIAAWWLAGVNLLVPTYDWSALSPSVVMAIYAVGVAASLPLTFVPMAALFDGEPPAAAFVSSLRAFSSNLRPLASLGVYSYALLMAGFVTYGIGIVLALPWIATASYAAWKDIFAVEGSATPSAAS